MADPQTTTAPTVPATMRAWVYDAASGGIETHMRLITDYAVPGAFRHLTPGSDALVVRVLAAAVNPVDYKVAELPLIGRFLPRRPTTPASDFCGRVVAAAAPGFTPGMLVAGKTADLPQHGALAEYVLAHASAVVAVPAGVSVDQAATIGICGGTAWGALVPHLKAVQATKASSPAAASSTETVPRIFVNGASGGVGCFAIQIAKSLGCHVTAACSARNAAFCRRLGADEVVDYTTVNVSDVLVAEAAPFDLALDLVGGSFALYKAADHYLVPGGRFVQVGVSKVSEWLWINTLPGFLGGGHHAAPVFVCRDNAGVLRQVLDLMAAGKLTSPIEEVLPFAEAPKAYTMLKTHRTRGKILVRVAEE